MKQAVRQQHDFGCGAACVAFAAKVSYQESVNVLGAQKASHTGFSCEELVKGLAEFGLTYEFKYIKPRMRKRIHEEGTIVFIRRSKRYPSGHYIIRHNKHWMDPWINLPINKNIYQARPGFRKRLPGKPIYVIFSV
jgi:hypothetical protein